MPPFMPGLAGTGQPVTEPSTEDVPREPRNDDTPPWQPPPPQSKPKLKIIGITVGVAAAGVVALAILGAILQAVGVVKAAPSSRPAAATAPSLAATVMHTPAARGKHVSKPAVPLPRNTAANIPGFSGPADPPTATRPGHIFGRCLHSWYTPTRTDGLTGPRRIPRTGGHQRRRDDQRYSGRTARHTPDLRDGRRSSSQRSAVRGHAPRGLRAGQRTRWPTIPDLRRDETLT